MTMVLSLAETPQTVEHALPDGIPAGLAGRPKRALDIAVASIALVAVAPLFLTLALLIKLSDRGPVFYRHERCGHQGRRFTLLKFRTMREDADLALGSLLESDTGIREDWERYRKLRDDPRVTKLGRFLRRSSLDELPQLLNVIRGEMSLVGPRPVISEELARFGALSVIYEAARPGITGLWQVSGRNRTCFETRMQMDAAYVREWSLRRDLAILARTIPAVLLARGAY